VAKRRIWNRSTICVLSLTFLVVLLHSGIVWALQTVTLTEGKTQFIDISQKDLNVIKLPGVSSIKAYTVSRLIDVKVEGDSIYVNVLDKHATAPQELFVVTASGTFPLMLIPKGVPAEMVVARTPSESIADAVQWEQSHDHVTGLKELIKAMYLEVPPVGFTHTKDTREVQSWQGTKRTVVAKYTGASLEGEVHELTNMTREPIRIVENEFYDRGVLAVSIERHEILPGSRTAIYLISRSATQKDMDATMRRYNPLEMLRTPHPSASSKAKK